MHVHLCFSDPYFSPYLCLSLFLYYFMSCVLNMFKIIAVASFFDLHFLFSFREERVKNKHAQEVNYLLRECDLASKTRSH